jgi:catechol 2,3-dioxygenase-like lactoylglutathione lyase family enzyme
VRSRLEAPTLGARVIETHGLNHISLSVSDPERSLAFYQKLFGVREYHRGEGEIQVLGPGPHDVIVFERRDSHGRPGGIDHFGFRLTDPAHIDEAVRQAEEAGALVRVARVRGFKATDAP